MKSDRDLPSAAVTTHAARQVWAHAYHTAWPKGWKVCWRDDFPPRIRHTLGCCAHHGKTVVLNWSTLKNRTDLDQPLSTLIHEFTHLRYPKLLHGKEFERIVMTVYGRLIGNRRVDEMLNQLALRARLRRLQASDRRRLRSAARLIREIQTPCRPSANRKRYVIR